MDFTVNLFTSFGYFDSDAEHAGAMREMIATVKHGGWFAIDFLNAAGCPRTWCPARTAISAATRCGSTAGWTPR
jgi:hypothetical protein